MTTQTRDQLRGAIAFQALATQIRSGRKPEAPFSDPCIGRLSRAIELHTNAGPNRPSALDIAVLARQALRFHEIQTSPGTHARIWVPAETGWPNCDQWEVVGVDAQEEDGGFSIQASPWSPPWLSYTTPGGVDAAAAGETQMRQDGTVSGDPYMAQFPGHDRFLTTGQRSAVRGSLSAPPGGTLVICLPTGDGKSYVFQLVAYMGYGANGGVPGVTLVITPTVALGLDHQRSAHEMGLFGHRLAYVGGMPAEERQAMVDRIRDGTQGLLFSAPEAVCGSLRSSLLETARAGLLRAIVVDEAHLVDAWGANFRPSFQVFSGFRKELLDVAPPEQRARTLLLSATLTDATVHTLCTLFPKHRSGDLDIQLVSAAQLRPEIEYWIAEPTTKTERDRRVKEALTHMPRPAILYTTEVTEAERWYGELRSLGFRRIGLMTGRSSTEERNKLVEDWRAQRLDLVVGTSAFGLGIDNQFVRTVIHACVPETLDRLYQEVGRGGRDGRSAASIIIPFRENQWLHRERDDYSTARGLNQRRLLTAERARERWEAMFNHPGKKYEGDGVFRLRVDGTPGLGPDYIDMVGPTNTEWNVRTLTLMANAGMIELFGPDTRPEPEEQLRMLDDDSNEAEGSIHRRIEQFQRIRVVEPNHLDPTVWATVVEPRREQMESAHRHNLNQMLRFLDGKECAAKTLSSIYELHWNSIAGQGISTVLAATACGGCPYCRANKIKRETEHPPTPRHPWPPIPRVNYPASELLDDGCRVLVFYDHNISPRALRRWTEALARLARCGVTNFICPPDSLVSPAKLQREVPDTAVFASEMLPPRDYLPPGPVALTVPFNHRFPETLLRRREPSSAHFIFVDRLAEYPDMPGIPLRSRFEGAQVDLDLFIERMNS